MQHYFKNIHPYFVNLKFLLYCTYKREKMSTKHTHPAFPPQIALDQFQRPIAPIPGMTMLDYFALNIYLHRSVSYFDAIEKAKSFLDALSKYQSEENLNTLKIISDEK